MAYTPAASFSFAQAAYVPVATFSWIASSEFTGGGVISVAGAGLVRPTPQAIGAGVIALVGASPVVKALRPIVNHWVATVYRCRLSGAADGLPDLALPLSSFQIRMGADPYRVYLSAVVPGADAYAAGIAVRPHGTLSVTRIYRYLDGQQASFEMAAVPFDSLSTNQGGRAGTTGTLSGYQTLTPAEARSMTLFDAITRASDAGRRRYRCRIDPRLRPLDTAVINGESFTVDGIILIVDTVTAIMEISEAV